MGLHSPALIASALVYFIQVSHENAGMRLLFVSQISQLSEEPGGKMNEGERHILLNQRGGREKELTRMFP